MVALFRELGWLHKSCALLAVSMVFLLGEIGHFLIGATSKVVAEDLHYGDITCQLNSSTLSLIDLPIKCGKAENVSYCESLTLNGSRYCEWNYNGLGWDYQVLAGPSFIAMFTVGGVIMGIIADKYNRVTFLAISTLVMGVAIALMGAVTEYRQLFILRMVLAFGEAGVSPLGTSLLSDWFPREQHGLVMSLFNWGVYGGWGITFPIGRYVPSLNVWGLSWRICYYIPGIVTIIFGIMVFFILEEPKKRNVGANPTEPADEKQQQQQKEGINEKEIIQQHEKQEEEDVSLCQVLLAPSFVLFCIAGCLRQCAGFCFAYNSDLYYRDYFPDVDLGWPLFWVTIFIGSVGVVVGGIISDKLVTRMGVKSRVAVLSFSQLMATPFALGSVGFGPLGAMMSLSVSFFFAEMWLGILFAILVAIIPTRVRTTAMSIFLFIINNVGGNLPILVEPTRQKIGYKEALYIYYAGFYFLSSIGFFITIFFMEGKAKVPKEIKQEEGHNNGSIIYDEKKVPSIELPIRPSVQEDKKS